MRVALLVGLLALPVFGAQTLVACSDEHSRISLKAPSESNPRSLEGEYRYNRLGRGWASRVPFSCEAERTGRSYFCSDDTYGVSFARITFPGGILPKRGQVTVQVAFLDENDNSVVSRRAFLCNAYQAD